MGKPAYRLFKSTEDLKDVLLANGNVLMLTTDRERLTSKVTSMPTKTTIAKVHVYLKDAQWQLEDIEDLRCSERTRERDRDHPDGRKTSLTVLEN